MIRLRHVVLLPLAIASVAWAQSQPAPAELVQVLHAEMQAGLRRTEQTETFTRYLGWTADRLDNSAGDKSWRDKTGNCRLPWVDQMLRDPLAGLGEGVSLTDQLQKDLHPESFSPTSVLNRIRMTMSIDAVAEQPNTPPDTLVQAVAVCLARASEAMAAALKPLSADELAELREVLYPVSTGSVVLGHSFADRQVGRRACDLMEKMDHVQLHRAALAVSALGAAWWTPALPVLPADQPLTPPAKSLSGVEGDVAGLVSTPAGDILIGGRGDNIYRLDEMTTIAAVIDLGGNDRYIEGTVNAERPVLLLLDLAGDDHYTGRKPGIQGAAVLGVSVLHDAAGNDRYEAADVAQGSCLAGVGILIDHGGDDAYVGDRRVQGSALGGVAMLIDRAGDDRYRAALLGQGVGGPLGFGLLADVAGNDEYFGGGKYDNGYGDSPGYEAWCQGVGAGPRAVANGGIGVILDGGGDDLYECDYFSHGGGYWFAAGFARDFGGNDRRIGATRTMHDGSPRTVKRFLRWGVGFCCHYGIGLVIDDQGDDEYRGDTACIGFGWDIGLGAILDFAGNDHYEPAQARACEASVAVIFDAAGDDVYARGTQAQSSPKVDYHPMPQAGGNFSFLVDYGGANQFAKDVVNHSYNIRGSPTSFLISRPRVPTKDEVGRVP